MLIDTRQAIARLKSIPMICANDSAAPVAEYEQSLTGQFATLSITPSFLGKAVRCLKLDSDGLVMGRSS